MFRNLMRATYWSPMLLLSLIYLISKPAEAAISRKYCYTVPTVASGQDTYFDLNQVRCDIVMFGETVTISEPLNTNGGDIVIVAERVKISAPIDTRPYFQTSKVFYDPSGSKYWVEPWSYYNDCGVVPSYAALFYWRESWDPAKYQWRFDVSKGHWDNFADDRLATPYSAPQLPAGRSPKFGLANMPRNGADAPTPSAESRLSGSILVVAGQIELCDTCTQQFIPRPPQNVGAGVADEGDLERRTFFVASGVKGGLGAPGTQGGCQKFDLCGSWDRDNVGGFNSPGGDAGDISLLVYDKASQDIGLLAQLSEADGGKLPFGRRVRVRSFNALNATYGRGEAAFSRIHPDERNGLIGENGRIDIKSNVDLVAALGRVQSQLDRWNLLRRYDPKLMVEEIRRRTGPEEVILPSDALRSYLLDLRRETYLDIVENVQQYGPQITNTSLKHGLRHSGFLSALDCTKSRYAILPRSISQEAKKLCELAVPVPIANIALFATDPNDVQPTSYDSLAIRQRLQRLIDAIQAISFDTNQITQLLDDANVKIDSAILRERIASLQSRILSLQQSVESPGLAGVLKSALSGYAKNSLPAIGELLSIIDSAQADGDPRSASGKYKKAGDITGRLMSDFTKALLPVWRDFLAEPVDVTPELSSLRQQMLKTFAELDQLNEEARQRREQRLGALGATAQTMLNERRSLVADYDAAMDSFDPLMRLTILRTAAQPIGSSEFLNERLMSLADYLRSFGKNSLPPTFFGSLPKCSVQDESPQPIVGPGEYKLADCVKLLNKSPVPITVRVRGIELGPLTLVRLAPGVQKSISLRDLAFERDSVGMVIATAEPDASIIK